MLPQNRWLVLAIVSSALFLIVVDMTVLYTALPRLTHDLAASASEKLWIMNIYPLVVAGLLPGLGTLTLQAIKGRDYAVVQAIIIWLGVTVIFANFVADTIRKLINPRLRTI